LETLYVPGREGGFDGPVGASGEGGEALGCLLSAREVLGVDVHELGGVEHGAAVGEDGEVELIFFVRELEERKKCRCM
jgi:hypothetical protein